MSFSPGHQHYSQLAVVVVVGLVAGLPLAGCKDAKPHADGVPPSPVKLVEEAAPEREIPSHPSEVKPSATPSPRVVDSSPPADPAELAKQFRAESEPGKRAELVDEIWNLDTPAAVDVLRQLFLIERELDVKIDIVSGLTESKKPETRESRFGLVVMALAPGQPKDLRELAAQILVDFDDPRALSLLQQYSQDADPEMREAVQEALETKRAVDQP